MLSPKDRPRDAYRDTDNTPIYRRGLCVSIVELGTLINHLSTKKTGSGQAVHGGLFLPVSLNHHARMNR